MTQYYVRTDGSDSNAGTSNTSGGAWRNISRANSTVVGGDIVNVNDGTYTYASGSSQGFTTTRSGSSGNQITYRSINKGGAKLVSTGTAMLWYNTGSFITVDGFDMSGSGNLAFYTEGANNIVSHNFVHDILQSGGPSGNGGAGIDTTGDNIQVFNNIVFNIDGAGTSGNSQTHGIYIAALGAKVYNNLIGYIAAWGIQQWHSVSDSIFVNNTVFNCGGGGVIIGCNAGISENNYVSNNIFANSAYGIYEYVEGSGSTRNNTYNNNITYNNPNGNKQTASGDVVSGQLTSNPLFINYQPDGSGNYHVMSTSPARDGGLALNAPAFDLDEATRPQGTTYDIGCYEFAGGGNVSSAVPGRFSNLSVGANLARITLSL